MLHTRRLLRTAPAIVTLLFALPAAAQTAAERPARPEPERRAEAPAAPQVIITTDQDARETRTAFESLLERLPPSVGRVMRIDPSLMRNPAYLSSYPALSSFLQVHPEVIQNSSYYLEHINYEFWNPRQPGDARAEAVRMWREMMQGLAIGTLLISIALALLWLVKTLVDYRRWYRTSKVQTEVHTKLLDRFTSNEDLMAYMQTSPGRRFLESAPLLEGPARPMGAPISRILWSLQVGVVLTTGAIGVLFISGRVIEEITQPIFAIGVLLLALGSGFIVSAGASFVVSRRLGLLDASAGREASATTGSISS